MILERLADDLLPLLEACAKGALPGVSPRFKADAALTVSWLRAATRASP